jgi:hypothetical protein
MVRGSMARSARGSSWLESATTIDNQQGIGPILQRWRAVPKERMNLMLERERFKRKWWPKTASDVKHFVPARV